MFITYRKFGIFGGKNGAEKNINNAKRVEIINI